MFTRRRLPVSIVMIGLAILLKGEVGQFVKAPQSYHTIANPAAVYCIDLGYQYRIVSDGSGGETDVCEMPNGTECSAWDFLAGKCGQDYSYCAQQGYGIETVSDGKDGFSPEYAVCVDEKGVDIAPVTVLSQLAEKASGCGDREPGVPEKEPPKEPDLFLPGSIASTPPPSFDWRHYQGADWLTPVKNQGSCGSCWAFSAVGAAEAALNIANSNPGLDLNLSEEYLVTDCHSVWGYQNCCGGWKDKALEYIRDNGIPDESCLPYVDGSGCTCFDSGTCSGCVYSNGGQCSNATCSDRCSAWSSRSVRINRTCYVGTNPTTIKQTLVAYGPLAVSMGVGGEYGGYFDHEGIYRCTDDSSTNHAVVIAGYDDAGGYWLVRNSWGAGWGDYGYFKVGYGECSIEQYVYYATNNVVLTTFLPLIMR